jgi:hypothetical protein
VAAAPAVAALVAAGPVIAEQLAAPAVAALMVAGLVLAEQLAAPMAAGLVAAGPAVAGLGQVPPVDLGRAGGRRARGGRARGR